MQKQFKYIYNNEEVSREDFEKLAGESFKWFDGDSIVSVPFSSFDSSFTGNFKSRRQINDHLDSVLNVYQNKVTEDIINKPKCSPQCFCDGSCKKPQQKNINSTRHKSQAGETHKEPFLVESSPLGYKDTNRFVEIKLDNKDSEYKDDVITNNSRGEKETMEYLQGVKETEGKVNYGELDFDYVDSMALRMSKNLEKYPPKNWQKNMDIEELAKSAIRHARKILQQIENDEETLEEHAIALGCNGMMINYQLKVK